ncbi:hypothetical protein E0500_036000 [Streptomyces sp. KM273126]|uniref:hypothetical protein n=1 Tax=Streptomyces sp. KM273126 TaxID=2545247 RepID=UPI001404F414|nr:hypothetical protein [Streptomyces sp. KM273126]MBA2812580.1 hypothetical protein [Streptomyces sp. KM273126]
MAHGAHLLPERRGFGLYDEAGKTWAAFSKEGVPQTKYRPKPYDPVNNKGG